MEYSKFLKSKTIENKNSGIEVQTEQINSKLFPFQKQIIQWTLKKGKTAIFADCGLGKSFMQLEWARLINKKTLILCPLAVAKQTIKEAEKLNIRIKYVRDQSEIESKISITNYEMVEHFNATQFDAVVLDESSILKSVNGKTKTKLIEMFQSTPYKLCCTATPAPNDVAEFANHAEFLNIATRQEMLSMFFVNDASHGEGWRLKGHAKNKFYKWLASWSIMLKLPSDIGFGDDGYILPNLNIYPEFVDVDSKEMAEQMGVLFIASLEGIKGRSRVRKLTIEEKVKRAVEIINKNDEQWIVWCGLNDEGRILHKELNGQSSLLEGQHTIDYKIDKTNDFLDNKTKVLISKTKISGFGLNLQNCHNQLFLGLSDSYETYYQAIRRSWRFGQKKPVNIHIVLSDLEHVILDNVLKKEKTTKETSKMMVENMSEFQKEELGLLQSSNDKYSEEKIVANDFTLYRGDCVEQMKNIKDESVDFSIFSPPFASLYVFSDSERDMSNCKNYQDFFCHFKYFLKEQYRVVKPGRISAVHVAQLATTLNHDGFIGIKDFRGKIINLFLDQGFNFHGEVAIDKSPEVQAVRNHVKGLMFSQLHKDSSWCRVGLADYLLLFRKPGENIVPIKPNITNEQWKKWARPIWYDINETNVLNTKQAKARADERHMTPLQLDLIERAIILWSNPRETVFSPFAGIGSEGYQAVKQNRKFVGTELKQEYFNMAYLNLERAISEKNQVELAL